MYRPRTEIHEAQQFVKSIKATDDRKREILANMYYAGCSLIGGLENTLTDYDEDDEEYIRTTISSAPSRSSKHLSKSTRISCTASKRYTSSSQLRKPHRCVL